MGFQASEAVEELSYNFTPYNDAHGTIPEPTAKQVERFRSAIVGSVTSLGLNPEEVSSGKVGFDQVGALMEKAGEVEQTLLDAISDLTGIPNSVLNSLPYRVQAAFSGYIVGVFLNPEA